MNSKHQQDLQHIRSMMERSSRFISLSGKSGITAGIVALAAAVLSYYLITNSGAAYFGQTESQFPPPLIQKLIIICIATLIIAVFFGIYLLYKKAKEIMPAFGTRFPKGF